MLMANEMPGMGRRLAAMALDLLLLKLLEAPLSNLLRGSMEGPVHLVLAQFVVELVYASILLNRSGQTLGKRVMKLRVMNESGGGVSLVQAAARSALKWSPVFGFLMLVFSAVPYLPSEVGTPPTGAPTIPAGSALAAALSYGVMLLGMVLFWLTRNHPDHRAPHDRASGTLVVRTP